VKKTLAVMVSILLVVALLGLAGCSKGKTSEPAASDKAKVTESAGGDAAELQKLFKSVKEVKGMSYDMVSTMSGKDANMKSQGKFFISGKKVRMEMEAQGMKSIIISNGSGEAYMYMPATNTAMKTPLPKEKPADAWAESEEDLADMKIVGHEKIDGCQCVVVTVAAAEGSMKMWLREDIGMPVRMETGDASNKMVIEYKNFKIGAQPDSLFELPAGAKVMDMSNLQNMPQMPNMPQGQNMPGMMPAPEGGQ